FATATGMDLCFDYQVICRQFAGNSLRFIRSPGRLPRRSCDAKFLKQLLGLIFVNVHLGRALHLARETQRCKVIWVIWLQRAAVNQRESSLALDLPRTERKTPPNRNFRRARSSSEGSNYCFTISAFSNIETPPLLASLPLRVTVLPASGAS